MFELDVPLNTDLCFISKRTDLYMFSNDAYMYSNPILSSVGISLSGCVSSISPIFCNESSDFDGKLEPILDDELVAGIKSIQ